MRHWTPALLMQTSGNYWESCALHAAVHLDVFTPLSEGALSPADLARRLSCDARALDMLITALCALGLLRRQDGQCHLEPVARECLCRDAPGYLGHIIEHHRHLVPAWGQLADAVRQGRPVRQRSSVDTENAAERESFLMGMYNIANAQARHSVPHLDLAGRTRLLDLGGGTGAYAIHFCRHNPGLTALVFDLPTSRPMAEKVIAQSGMAERIRFQAGNYLRDPLPDGFDVAWLSQILHGEKPDDARRVVAKAAAALRPGGLLLIQEFLLDDHGDGPLQPALFSLNMLVGTAGGQAYAQGTMADFMRAAGAEEVIRCDLPLPEGCVVLRGRMPD